MDKHWKKIKSEDYEDTFDKTSQWIYKNQINQNALSRERNFKMKKFFAANKYKFAVVIILALIIAACNYPVTQSNTVGYALSWTSSVENTDAVNNAVKKLPWSSGAPVIVTEKSASGNKISEFKMVLQNTDEKTVFKYQNDLEKIREITSVKITPLTESITRPVYAAALYSFFRIDVNSKNMSDEEVIRTIGEQLKSAGIENAIVEFTVGDKGNKRLMIRFPEDKPLGGNNNVEVRVNNDGKEDVIKMKTIKSGSDKDPNKMTDEEIKADIMSKNPDVKPENIKITREDGKAKVEVKVEN